MNDPELSGLVEENPSSWTWSTSFTSKQKIKMDAWMIDDISLLLKSGCLSSVENDHLNSTCRATKQKSRKTRKKIQSKLNQIFANNKDLLNHFFLLFSIISVRAKSFAEREIRYTLKAQGQGAGTFNIGPTTGNVRLAKDLDFEDLRQPHVYQLQVINLKIKSLSSIKWWIFDDWIS